MDMKLHQLKQRLKWQKDFSLNRVAEAAVTMRDNRYSLADLVEATHKIRYIEETLELIEEIEKEKM